MLPIATVWPEYSIELPAITVVGYRVLIGDITLATYVTWNSGDECEKLAREHAARINVAIDGRLAALRVSTGTR
jgi:hypothetical protein